MSDSPSDSPGHWTHGQTPPNVRLGAGTVVTGDYFSGDGAFKRFRSRLDPGLVVGAGCVLDGVYFNVAERGFVSVGDGCRFRDAFLICESRLDIGSRVVISWRATVVDSDFHPIDPALRMADSEALAPGGDAGRRPPFVSRPVVIEDDVFIGALAVVLKGVRIGRGAFVEPGAVVTRDVPAGARVIGNPATVVPEG